jgi:Coenzyme PQQ synthesis protein D (PqqD)
MESRARSATCCKPPVTGERYTVSEDAAFAAVPGGGVVLHMDTKRYYSLNETGAEIWALMAAGEDCAAIADRLTDLYDISIDDAQAAVDKVAGELASEGLITLAPSARA